MTMTTPKQPNGLATKLALSLLGLLGAFALGFTTTTASDLRNHKERSAKDCLEIWKEISEIKEAVAQVPKQVPPTWFVDRVDKLEQKIDSLDAKVDALQ